MAEHAQGFEKFPQILINVRVSRKRDYSKIAEIQKEIEAASKSLGERGRVVIRYSGTEPLVRIMLEGEKESEIKEYAEAIAARFEEKMGATES